MQQITYAIVPTPTVLEIQANIVEALNKSVNITPAEVLTALILQFVQTSTFALGATATPADIGEYETSLYSETFGDVVRHIAIHAKCAVTRVPEFTGKKD